MNKHQLFSKLEDYFQSASERLLNSGLDQETQDKIESKAAEDLCSRAETILTHSVDDMIAHNLAIQAVEKSKEQEYFTRFTLIFRIQHIFLFTSVITLVFTGLPLKFPDAAVSRMIFTGESVFLAAKLIHRIAAGVLITVGIFHLFYIIASRDGRSNFKQLLPRFKDAKDIADNIKYFIGRSKTHARFDRFSYIEKFDYWAVYWGCVIMIGTGMALGFQDVFLRFMPKYLLDVIKEMHSDEALLATLALVIWHFYNVHFNPSRFPGTLMWWHGKISTDEIKKEHPIEYERILKERIEKNSGKN